MLAQKSHLTARIIAALEPRAAPYRVHDADERGLAVEVRPTGEKSFVYRRQVRGDGRQETLGRVGDLSLREAREAAHARTMARRRGDPGRRHSPTLAELWTTYEARHLPRLAPRTAADYRDRWWPHLAWLADRRIDAITRADVARLHADLCDRSPITANRVRALLGSLYGRAIEWGLHPGPSPVAGVRAAPEARRRRFLDRPEVARLLAALDSETPVVRDYVRVLLMTGARRGEVMAMRWDEIRGDLWIHRQKGGGEVTLPLAPQVVAILAARPRLCEYVFPGRWGKGHLVSINSAWRRVRAAAGLQGVRLHDLRHTLASWQAMTGASLQVIGASLGHSQVSTTERYAHLQLAQVRASVEGAVAAMMEKEESA